MSRFGIAFIAALALAPTVLAAPAGAVPSDYGFESVEASLSTAKAGEHPDFTTAFSLEREANNELPSTTRDLIFDLPPGLLLNPTAAPTCSLAQFTSTNLEEADPDTGCPVDSQVGFAEIEVYKLGSTTRVSEPIYNIAPREGEPARLGLIAASFPILISTHLRPDRQYGGTGVIEGASSLIPLLSSHVELWAVPASPVHDSKRITPYEGAFHGGAPETPNGKRSVGLAPKPFIENPTRCNVAQGVDFTAVPYAEPQAPRKASASLDPNYGCELLNFDPRLSLAPSDSAAQSGTGLEVGLDFPTAGFEDPKLPIDSVMRSARVLLPEGLTVNPSQAVGLEACSEAELAEERFDSAPGEGCSEASKIGSLTAASPLLPDTATGALFVATPYQNPFGTLIALYMVVKIPARGVIVKLPMKVEVDPVTGQLSATVDEIPQLPVSSFSLSFRSGGRAPLVTPASCGAYEATASFTSWGGQSKTVHPSFRIDRGAGGAPCPRGAGPFEPGFEAGTLSNSAGSYSPFYMRLTRGDADQELRSFLATLPPGVTAKLAGATQCPEAAIAAAGEKSGAAEQAAPSCPSSSRIGGVQAGAGVGDVLTYAGGEVYLAGPYRGAPLSAVAIVRAVAGPFDLGTVVTRLALRLDPRTGVVTADGSADPIPRLLAGIPLRVRDVRANLDRPKFSLNPTSCEPFQTTAQVWSESNAPFGVAARFQAANCSRLGFKPRLTFELEGGTHRGANPALRSVYRPRPHRANLARLVVRLPRSAFLDQAHIRTICTRVQFAAGAGHGAECPKGSIYGHAKAVTPLLDKPLSGPIYLRSSSHDLPDVVAALHGTVDIEAVARIDSVNGGIRATFTDVPDAPLTKVVVSMQGAEKGLIVNSTDLCRGTHRIMARLEAHNAMRRTISPAMRVTCGAKHRGGRGRSGRRS